MTSITLSSANTADTLREGEGEGERGRGGEREREERRRGRRGGEEGEMTILEGVVCVS